MFSCYVLSYPPQKYLSCNFDVTNLSQQTEKLRQLIVFFLSYRKIFILRFLSKDSTGGNRVKAHKSFYPHRSSYVHSLALGWRPFGTNLPSCFHSGAGQPTFPYCKIYLCNPLIFSRFLKLSNDKPDWCPWGASPPHMLPV